MEKNTRILFLLFVFVISLNSCGLKKNIVYLQEKESGQSSSAINYELRIQPDDYLKIIISAENPEVAAPYNLKSYSVQGAMEGQNLIEGYLVGKNGTVELPQLGQVTVGGLTCEEVSQKIKKLLEEHIQNPSVQVKIANFKVSVLGEVKNPGVHSVAGERLSLLEALSLSGDLTITGKRKNIMIVREQNGQKTIQKVDITDAAFINSPYYYLCQNDVVYVEPNGTRVNDSVIGPDIRTAISVLSFAIAVVLLITK